MSNPSRSLPNFNKGLTPEFLRGLLGLQGMAIHTPAALATAVVMLIPASDQ